MAKKKIDVVDDLIGGSPTVAPLSVRDCDAAAMLGVSVETLRNWRKEGIGPRYAYIGKRTLVYPVDQLKSYLVESLVNG